MAYDDPSALHYRALFDVVPLEPSDNDWGRLISEIKWWVVPKVPKADEGFFGDWFFRGGSGSNPDYKLFIKTARCVGTGTISAPQYWAFQMEEADRNCPLVRRWRTDIGITVLTSGKTEFSIRVSFLIKPGFIGDLPPEPITTTPGIVQRLLCVGRWKAYAGGERLSCDPIMMPVGGIPTFKAHLFSPKRLCPILYISRSADTGTYHLDPETLGKALAGNAIVTYAASSDIDEEMAYHIPKTFHCKNGLVRVYLPMVDFASDVDSRRHRFFSPANIAEMGCQKIESMLIRGLVRQSKLMRRPEIASLDDVYAKSRLWKLNDLLKKQTEKPPLEWMQEVENLMKENDQFKGTINSLEDRQLELEERIEEKEDDLARKEFEKNEIQKTSDEYYTKYEVVQKKLKHFESLTLLPQNLQEVVNLIEVIHSEHIVFTKEAQSSIRDYDKICDKNGVDPSMAWECLWAMATVLHDLYFGAGSNNIRADFKTKTAFDIAMSESSQTQKDTTLMKLRRITYDGQVFDIQAHVKAGTKAGKSLRVYYDTDKRTNRIIVGHCGDHLDTAGTRHL